VATKPLTDHLILDHLASSQAQDAGIGALVLRPVFDQAESLRLPVKVGALMQSDSSRFYLRHGFELVGQGDFDSYYIRPLSRL